MPAPGRPVVGGAPRPVPLSAVVSCRRDRGPMPSPPFPSTVPSHDIPFPPQGLLGTDSPASTVLWNAPTPHRPSRRAWLPSLVSTIRHGRFAPFGGPWDAEGPGVLLIAPLSPMRLISNGNDGASQVPGGPLCACPALRPRRDLRARPYGASVRPSAFRTASAPAIRFFRGSITRPTHPLSTLRRMDHSTTTQDSLPAVASFPAQSASLCKVPTKGFSIASHPPFPSFS